MAPSSQLVFFLLWCCCWFSFPHAQQQQQHHRNRTKVVSAYDLKYASHHLYVNQEHRLVYCAIPKVACSEFMRLFYRLKGRNKDRGLWTRDPHFRPDKPLLKDLGAVAATKIMNDPSFTKFVFFRDPAERLLSAWIDKFKNGQKYTQTRSYGIKFYGNKNMSFADFVDVVSFPPSKKRSDFRGLGPYANPHWRPQRFMCGLDKFLGQYDFVGSFGKLREHAEHLLRSLGLWQDYGASGWTSSSRPIRGHKPAPDGPIFAKNLAWHRARDSDRRGDFLTEDLLSKIKAAYHQDYEMLRAINFTNDMATPISGKTWPDYTRRHYTKGLLCMLDRPFCDEDDIVNASSTTDRRRRRQKPAQREATPQMRAAALRARHQNNNQSSSSQPPA